MATVHTYWSLPEDEIDFLDYLSKWEIYAYPPKTFPNAADVIPVPIKTVLLESNPSQLDFGPKHLLSTNDIGRRNLVEGIQFYGVSPMNSQTIGYSRPQFLQNGALCKSNLYAYWKYPNESVTGFVEKSPEFIKWAKVIFRWSRKHAPEKLMSKGYFYPATKRVKELADQNKLVLGL